MVYEKLITLRSSGIYFTIYHNSSYLLVIKSQLRVLKFHVNSSSFEISMSLLSVQQLKASKLNNQKGCL